MPGKEPGKGAQTGEADVQADVRYGAIGSLQEATGRSHPAFHPVTVRRQSVVSTKRSNEMLARKARDPREFLHGGVGGIPFIDQSPHPLEPLVFAPAAGGHLHFVEKTRPVQ